MRTIDIILYVIAVVVLGVVVFTRESLAQLLFAVALICVVLVPLIALVKAS